MFKIGDKVRVTASYQELEDIGIRVAAYVIKTEILIVIKKTSKVIYLVTHPSLEIYKGIGFRIPEKYLEKEGE